ncbi:MAG: hypothetical protein HY537_04765 [Deltaproteobacteria bacterium]|nr:hypothetical protein [Deltaproteobacteria bacterium]
MIRRILLFILTLGWTFLGQAVSPEDNEIISKFQKIQSRGDFVEKTVRRIGKQTLELESFISEEADLKVVPKVFAAFGDYGKWALAGINVKPKGGRYYVQILDLVPEPSDPTILQLRLSLEFPLYHSKLMCRIKMKTTQEAGVTTVRATMIQTPDSIVESAEGFLKIFKSPQADNRAWFYVKAYVTLRVWLLYEMVPLPVMTREAGERIQMIVSNYQKEEDRRLLASSIATKNPKPPPPASKSNQSPKGKKGE